MSLIRGLNRYRGANFLEYSDQDNINSAKSFNSIHNMKKAELNTLVIVVTWFQNSLTTNTIYRKTTGYWQTPSDTAVIKAVEYAKSLNLKTVVKLHINPTNSNQSRTDILPTDFTTWWESKKGMVFHYAQICQQNDVDMFIISTELSKVDGTAYSSYWKSLIAQVRNTYSGIITYAANWDNYQNVSFWSDLNMIGIDAYFPLLPRNEKQTIYIKQAWTSCQVPGDYYGKNWLQTLRDFSIASKKNILFTEIGYSSKNMTDPSDSVLAKPYSDPDDFAGTVDMEVQTKAYAGFIETFLREDWFEGFFIWEWKPDPVAGGYTDNRYTPQNKPVIELLKSLKYYDEETSNEKLELISKPKKVLYEKNENIEFAFLAHEDGDVSLKIYNGNYSLFAEEKKKLSDEQMSIITIDYNEVKTKISRGVYFYRIEFNDFETMGRFVIIK